MHSACATQNVIRRMAQVCSWPHGLCKRAHTHKPGLGADGSGMPPLATAPTYIGSSTSHGFMLDGATEQNGLTFCYILKRNIHHACSTSIAFVFRGKIHLLLEALLTSENGCDKTGRCNILGYGNKVAWKTADSLLWST